MHKPPDEYCRSHKQQSENLIAPENALLLRAARGFSLLLSVRLDVTVSHWFS